MAKKRALQVETPDREIEEQPDEVRTPRESTWREWLRGTYAKYWYGIICLFVDVVVALELSKSVEYPWSYLLPFIVVSALVLVQWQFYLKLWSKKRARSEVN